jgi:hypothetical protein
MPGPTDQKRLGHVSHCAIPELSKPAEALRVMLG